MTPTEIIEIVDRITPNAHTTADKLRWLCQLDAEMRAELFPDAGAPDDPAGALLVPDPYAEELYGSYLQACMAWADEEDARYDRFITRFNDAFLRYARLLMETRVRAPRLPLRF